MSIPQYPETHLERYLDVMAGGKGPLPDEPENHLEVYLDFILGGSRQPEYPESRVERYLDKMAGLSEIIPTQPETRIERYLSVAVGGDGTKPTDPETRTERYLDGIADNPPRKAADNTNDTNAVVPDNSLAVARIDQIGGQTIKDGTNPLKYSLPVDVAIKGLNILNYSRGVPATSLGVTLNNIIDGRIVNLSGTASNNGYFFSDVYISKYDMIVGKTYYCKSSDSSLDMLVRVVYGDGRVIYANIFTYTNDIIEMRPYIQFLNGNTYNGDYYISISPINELILEPKYSNNVFTENITKIKSRLESLGYSTDVLGYSNGKTGAEWDGNYIDLVNGNVHIKYNRIQIPVGVSMTSFSVGRVYLPTTILVNAKIRPRESDVVANLLISGFNTVDEAVLEQGDFRVGLSTSGFGFCLTRQSTPGVPSELRPYVEGKYVVYELENETIIDVSDIIKGGRVNVEPGGTVALNTTENAGHMNITWIKAGHDPVALMAAPVRVLSDQEDILMESEVIENGKAEFKPLENLVSEEDLPYIVMDIEASNGLDQDA